ncbi:hypothetical protein KUF83_28150 [Streptomyces sp. BV286]|uniref:hypothetical protein n=1 Tax=Streptomyces sp. BV286 TaxID=2849672 RepID=UPI001C2E01E4|nr:hypothetical protein [Streptomyces sp. BV286]MBV1940412.1 hypothetical protein [Streptomyces sp. BV286]
MPRGTLHCWIKKGWLTAHQRDDARDSWIIHADAAEVERLRQLHEVPRGRGAREAWFHHQRLAIVRNEKGHKTHDGEPHI